MTSPRSATPVTGISALAGLLVVVFCIAGLLVYEAWSTGRSRREIAERGLQDYAAYATWSTARAADLAIGSSLSTLFRGLASNRIGQRSPLPPLSRLVASARDADDCKCSLVVPADYYFRLDFRDGRVTTARPSDVERKEEPSGWAAAKVGSFAPTEPAKAPLSDDGSWLAGVLTPAAADDGIPFRVLFLGRRNAMRAVGFVPQRDSAGRTIGMLGFVSSPEQYANSLFTHLWRSPRILPAAITRGIPDDSLLTATVSTSDGTEIYRSTGWEQELLSDTASLASFGGGMKVRVALRRDAIARLGGRLIPASRIPVWVGLLLLTGLLTAIILRNLKREHELARLRVDFTASVSHELRTPLAQILLFGETLTLGRTRSESERSRAAEVIVREARRLMQLVENALQFSRAERPAIALSRERVPLAPAVREVIAAFEPVADARGVRIVADLNEEPESAVDRSALRQMLMNLLDNALKYGPPEQTISVGLSGPLESIVLSRAMLAPDQPQLRHVARLWVDDEGPGIPAGMQHEIWTAFVRGGGDSGTGCGLGLAVVRELAEGHDGKAWVESAPAGNGSRFIIELPAFPASSNRIDGGGRHDGGGPGDDGSAPRWANTRRPAGTPSGIA